MLRKITLLILGILVLTAAGCRTGEYKDVDQPIYDAMPALLQADEYVYNHTTHKADGSVEVWFEKGVMYLYLLADSSMDEDARMNTTSAAFEIFHEQYMNCAENVKKDGTFKREVIYIKAYVEDIELYVLEWNLNEDNPNVLDNRSGNYL